MNQSENINELAAALALAQGTFKIADEDKTNYFKSKYASYEALRKASQKALSDNGLCITHILSMTEKGQVLGTQLSHKSGQWMRSEVLLPVGGKGESTHELGKSITYCKRYSYAALICIGTGEEDEDENVGHEVEKVETQNPVYKNFGYTDEDLIRFEKQLKDSDQFKGMLKYYKVATLLDLPIEKKAEAMVAVNNMLKGAK